MNVHEVAIRDLARRGQQDHGLAPAGVDGLRAVVTGGHQCYGVQALLETAQRDRPQAIALVDALALLGRAQPSAEHAGRHGPDQRGRAAAAGADRAAAAVEHQQFDSGGITGFGHRSLRLPQ